MKQAVPAKSAALAVVLSIAVLLSALPASGELKSHLRKYRSTTISRAELDRLNDYDHLIEYFCSFSYFSPGKRVSPDFIKALILAESGAEPLAVSPKQALGLAQIRLETGRIAGRQLAAKKETFKYVTKEQLRNITTVELLDPAVNILLACYLIAKYNHRYEGRLDLVVSAWNAGENTKSLAAGKHAPYTETKDLIGKVNSYYLFLLRQKGAVRY